MRPRRIRFPPWHSFPIVVYILNIHTRVIRAVCSLLASHSLDSVVVVRLLPGGIQPVPTFRIERHYDLCWNSLDDMQTIKCIVVGDGAVGKVRDGSSLHCTCERVCTLHLCRLVY